MSRTREARAGTQALSSSAMVVTWAPALQRIDEGSLRSVRGTRPLYDPAFNAFSSCGINTVRRLSGVIGPTSL